MQQQEFGVALARNTDPETSKTAADEVEGEEASKMEQKVVDALARNKDGLTNHELVSATGVDWNSITPRVRPLVRKQIIEDSGVKRMGPKGKNCIVWRLKARTQ